MKKKITKKEVQQIEEDTLYKKKLMLKILRSSENMALNNVISLQYRRKLLEEEVNKLENGK